MAYDSALEACRLHLYTPDDQLAEIYPEDIAAKVSRVRALHQWILSNPGAPDAEVVRECVSRFSVSKPTAYSDLRILKILLPMISEASKDFHRWRYLEMILLTFEMSRKRGDTRSMERAATSYAKYTKIDEEEKSDIPVDQIIPQQFIATDDPSVLGIKKIPNIRQKQQELIEKYTKESADIQDIDYEIVDLEEDSLFPDTAHDINPIDNA